MIIITISKPLQHACSMDSTACTVVDFPLARRWKHAWCGMPCYWTQDLATGAFCLQIWMTGFGAIRLEKTCLLDDATGGVWCIV